MPTRSTIKNLIAHKAINGSFVSVMDQGIVSLSNFLSVILVARAVSPEQFGVYSLFIAGIFFLSSLQSALITTPLRVLGVCPSGVENGGYFKAHIYLQGLLGGLLVLATVLILSALGMANIQVLLSFSVCLFFFQFQELVRVINITRLSFWPLLWIDALTHSLRIGSLLFLSAFKLLTPDTALLVIGVSSAIGAMAFLLGKIIKDPPSVPLLKIVKINWNFGKWILLEGIASFSSTQVYLYFIVLLLSTGAAGGLNAVQSLLNTVNVLLIGGISFATPMARRKLIDHGYKIWRRWMFQVGLVLTIGTSLIVLAISLFAEPLLTSLYSPFYAQYAHLVPILSISYCLMAVNTTFRTAFYTANLPQIGPVARSVSAVLTLTIAYPLLIRWGVRGAVFGLIFTQVIWILVYIFFIAKGTISAKKVTTLLLPA
ncbi:MAG: hypothetical protein ABGZ19_10025 [Verrucomicrobiales bacterium]|nr:hypothetical protein [Nitrospinaceae bacterium]